jgi:hypothetical protein
VSADARLRPHGADRRELPPARRRPPRAGWLEPARIPRHRHARGSRGRRLRGRGDARNGPRRGCDRTGDRGRLAPARREGLRARRRRVPLRLHGRCAADGPGGRARAARRRRYWRAPAARAPRCRRADRSPGLAQPAQPGQRDRARARPARRARRDSQLPRRRAVLPVGACARLVRLALVHRRTTVRDDGEGGRRGAPRGPPRDSAGGAPDAGRRPGARCAGQQRRRLSARRAGGCSDRDRGPSRRLVQRRLRQRRSPPPGTARATHSASRRAPPRSTA